MLYLHTYIYVYVCYIHKSFCITCIYHFIVISNGTWFLQSLKPHHVLCVESPRQLLERLGRHVLGLSSLGGEGGEEEEEGGRGEEEEEGGRGGGRGRGGGGRGER